MKASKSIHRADVQRPAFLGSLDLVIAAGGSPGDHDESVPHVDPPSTTTTTTTTTTPPRPTVPPAPQPKPQPQVQPAGQVWVAPRPQYAVVYPGSYYMIGC